MDIKYLKLVIGLLCAIGLITLCQNYIKHACDIEYIKHVCDIVLSSMSVTWILLSMSIKCRLEHLLYKKSCCYRKILFIIF